ncbi:ribonuclease HI family protein [Macrococcus sp. DPC7161]|uniref:ribonuclease HI family protein n=1 Tax=Macrococcus sp. DPC7161 TaxID=2507060 RepID=UPI00100AEFCD|nr:ribonuclease HI family protein [Macrococcus sp. DPC7161]RXK19242.1 ribonuclease HI family protein [Macrococcus sp. DPC7161]
MVKVYIDASTKQSPLNSACGIVIKSDTSNQPIEYGQHLGAIDNHIAEWQSLIIAMDLLIANQFKQALIFTDSKIVADSIDKLYVKNKAFLPYLEAYQSKIDYFDLCLVNWIPRNENKHADHIARKYLK